MKDEEETVQLNFQIESQNILQSFREKLWVFFQKNFSILPLNLVSTFGHYQLFRKRPANRSDFYSEMFLSKWFILLITFIQAGFYSCCPMKIALLDCARFIEQRVNGQFLFASGLVLVCRRMPCTSKLLIQRYQGSMRRGCSQKNIFLIHSISIN